MSVPSEHVVDTLLEIARGTRMNRDRIEIITPPFGADVATGMNRVALAVRFASRGPAFHLRAIFEDWDLNRIIRELNT